MDKINIIYIDDTIDNNLNFFLNEIYKKEFNKTYKSYSVEIDCNEHRFQIANDGDYKNFLKNDKIINNDIILIDSLLFENKTITKHYTGEQLKLIINKIYPYKKVLIISQYSSNNNYSSQIKKFNNLKTQNKNKAINYYQNNLAPYLDYAIKEILDQRKVIDNMIESKNFDKNLVEKLENSINNIQEPYEDFSEKDLNELINLFTQIKDEFNRNE